MVFKDERGHLTEQRPFKYPQNLPTIAKYCEAREDIDLYFSPMLYKVPDRKAEKVSFTPVVYADTDSFDPTEYLIAPSINVRTSTDPLKRHSYWILDTVYSPQAVSTAARAIALTHASKDAKGNQTGVDPSGWDLSQLLRVPNSMNLKYEALTEQGEPAYPEYTAPQTVYVENTNGNIYSLDDITSRYRPGTVPDRVTPATGDLPEDLPSSATVLAKMSNDKKLLSLYSRKLSAGEDRSDLMYAFCSAMFRAGFTPEEVVVAAWQVSYNKYAADKRPMEHLWKYDVLKAYADPENAPRSTVDVEAVPVILPKTITADAISKALLSEEEHGKLTRTFVDEYVDWVSPKVDSPSVYHIAGAMTVMSCVLGEVGYVIPKFGETTLGLMFMIMGETTKTFKTTSRTHMKKVIRACQIPGIYDYLLTNDVTPETLVDNLAERPNITSLYDRDEAQQLIADVKGGKSYMKGFFETLNQLYDGISPARSRQGKSTPETPVVFVQYLMGIRTQIQENLEVSDFTSGYLPRNIFVNGEPKEGAEDNFVTQGVTGGDMGLVALAQRITTARDAVQGDRERGDKREVVFDDDAWARIWGEKGKPGYLQQVDSVIQKHPKYEYLSPSVNRLTVNIMKVAALFALSEGRVNVTMTDTLNAIYYSLQWLEDLVIMVDGVTDSVLRRQYTKIIDFMGTHNGLVTRVNMIQWARGEGWDNREFSYMLEALIESEQITEVNDGSGKKCLQLL